MIFWLTVMIGVLAAIIGLRKGFFFMWAIFFNLLIAIYLGIMLTPAIVKLIPGIEDNGYHRAGCVAGIAIVTFAFLYTVAIVYFYVDSKITLPQFIDKVGTCLVSFFTGYLICSFVFFVVCVMPFSKAPLMKKILGREKQAPSAVATIQKSCSFVDALSLQCRENPAGQVVAWLTGAPDKAEDDKDIKDNTNTEDTTD